MGKESAKREPLLRSGQGYVEPAADSYSAGRALVRSAGGQLEGPRNLALGILFVGGGFSSHARLLEGIQDELREFITGKKTTRTKSERKAALPLVGCTANQLIVNGELYPQGAGLCLLSSPEIEVTTSYVRGRVSAPKKNVAQALDKCGGNRLTRTGGRGFLLAFFPEGRDARGNDGHSAFVELVGMLTSPVPTLATCAEKVEVIGRGERSICFADNAVVDGVVMACVRTELEFGLSIEQAFTQKRKPLKPTLLYEEKQSGPSQYLMKLGNYDVNKFCKEGGSQRNNGPLVAIPISHERSYLIRPYRVSRKGTHGNPIDVFDMRYPVRKEWRIPFARISAKDCRKAAESAAKGVTRQLSCPTDGLLPLVYSCKGKRGVVPKKEHERAFRGEIEALNEGLPGAAQAFGAYVGGEFGYRPPDIWPANYSFGVLAIGAWLSEAASSQRDARSLVAAAAEFSRTGMLAGDGDRLLDSFFDKIQGVAFQGGLVRLAASEKNGRTELKPVYSRDGEGQTGPLWSSAKKRLGSIGYSSSRAPARAYRNAQKEASAASPLVDDGGETGAFGIENRIVLPVLAGMRREPLGTLELGLPRGYRPQPEFMNALTQIVGSLGQFLSIIRREKALADGVTRIKDLAENASTEKDFLRLLEVIARTAGDLTRSTYVTLRLLKKGDDGKKRELILRSGWQAPSHEPSGKLEAKEVREPFAVPGKLNQLLKLDRGKRTASAEVIITGLPHINNDIKNDFVAHQVLEEITGHLIVPMTFAGDSMGCINCNHTEHREYDARDIYLLDLLASESATAIHLARTRIHWEAIRNTIEAFVRAETSAKSTRAKQSTARTALKEAVGGLQEALGAEGTVVFAARRKAAGRYERIHSDGDVPSELDVEEVHAHSEGFSAQCIKNRTRVTPGKLPNHDLAGFCFFASGPFLTGGMVAFCKSLKRGGFDDSDQALLEAAQAAVTSGFRHANAVDTLHQALISKENRIAAQTHQLVKPIRLARDEIKKMPVLTPELEVALKNYDRFDDIISLLLRLETLEKSKSAEWKKPVNTDALFESVIARAKPLAEQCGVTLRVDLAASATPEVLCDGELLGEAIFNLVDNAIKFTPDGGAVTLSARIVEAGEQAPTGTVCPVPLVGDVEDVSGWLEALGRDENGVAEGVLLQVHDSGEGVSRQGAKTMFLQGQTSKPSNPSGMKGLGFGLTVVNEIVSVHDGVVFSSTGKGDGQVFSILLPM